MQLTDREQNFFSLTPEVILSSLEEFGFQCGGRCMALNSMENRVYEVEVDADNIRSPSDRFKIIKFYRPGRWSADQIWDEHEFLYDLDENEIPVIAPLVAPSGYSLLYLEKLGIYYTAFPKMGGRCPDELSLEQYEIVGRLLARMHNVGASKKSLHRIKIGVDTYGLASLSILQEQIDLEFRQQFLDVAQKICELVKPWFAELEHQYIRIHGDCHGGNLLWGQQGPYWIDFDDMVVGPAVQDLWLLIRGRYDDRQQAWDALLRGYNMMRPFDRRSLRLVEPLRALRMLMFTAWIAKRWHDPIFKRYFPQYGTRSFWRDQVQALHEQYQAILTAQYLPG